MGIQMKALIIGNGQLGSYIYNHWNNFNNIEIYVVDYPQFDITNKELCQNAVKENDIIINCAAYTLVDKAEEDFQNCMRINCNGPMNLAFYCKKYNKKLIHISSQSVYGSNDDRYYPMTETHKTTPTTIYSISKLNGDNNIQCIMNRNYLILRSGWLFGPNNDHNFIQKIKQLLLSKDQIKVVTDQIGSLTSVEIVSNAIKDYINGYIPAGLYNIANDEYASRFQNANFVKSNIESKCIIHPCLSDEFKRTANVAKNSCINCNKIKKFITFKIPTWKEDVLKVLKGQM